MPIEGKYFIFLTNRIQKNIEKINFFLKNTENNSVEKLKFYLNKLVNHEVNLELDARALEKILRLTDCLILNLEYAKQAVNFTTSKLIATNIPPFHQDKIEELEQIRIGINQIEITKQFTSFKERREKLVEHPGVDSSVRFFEQSTYRKGTGSNIRQWSHYAMNTCSSLKKLGNCSEQSSLSFGYLYTIAYEHFIDYKYTPFNSIERIDVVNKLGGHSYLLIDRNKSVAIQPNTPQDVETFYKTVLGETCVVVDPWNIEYPFYPASDINKKMPKSGMHGQLVIEFGLDFSNQSVTSQCSDLTGLTI